MELGELLLQSVWESSRKQHRWSFSHILRHKDKKNFKFSLIIVCILETKIRCQTWDSWPLTAEAFVLWFKLAKIFTCDTRVCQNIETWGELNVDNFFPHHLQMSQSDADFPEVYSMANIKNQKMGSACFGQEFEPFSIYIFKLDFY